MRVAHRKTLRIALHACIACACTLVGCNQSTNLDAVRALAASATTSQQTFNDLAADYYDTCLRRNVYQSIGASVEAYFPRAMVSNPLKKVQTTPMGSATAAPISDANIATLSADELVQRLTVDVARTMSEGQVILLLARLDSSQILSKLSPDVMAAFNLSPALATQNSEAHACDLEQGASRAWVDANNIIIAYFVALGKLAGGAPAADSYGVKALASDIAVSKALSSARATSIGNFANDAIDQVYAAKRRGALAAFIPLADESLGNAIKLVESLATDDYTNALSRERVVANRFFRRNLELAQPGEQAFEVLSYADTWSQRMKALDDRVGAVQSYKKAWETLRSGHAKLLAAISNNDSKSALAIAQGIYDAMAPDISALKKAFTGGK